MFRTRLRLGVRVKVGFRVKIRVRVGVRVNVTTLCYMCYVLLIRVILTLTLR